MAKNPRGGAATEEAGELSRLRSPTPPEWQREPERTKSQEAPHRPRTDGGKTDGGRGEGKKTHPPPDQPGCRETTAETARRWAEIGRRSRPTRWRQRRIMAARGPGKSNPTASTAPGLSTARLRVASTTYW